MMAFQLNLNPENSMRLFIAKWSVNICLAFFFVALCSVLLGVVSFVSYREGRTPDPTISSMVLGYHRAQICRYDEWDLHGVGNEGRTNGAWSCDWPVIKQTAWAQKAGWPDNAFTRALAGEWFWPIETVCLLLLGMLMLAVPNWLFGTEYMKEYVDRRFPDPK